MPERITIGVVFGERGGSSYHRQVTPHAHLSKKYMDQFEVLFFESFDHITDDDFKRLKLIQFHRLFGKVIPPTMEWTGTAIMEKCKIHGIATILDLDDHWVIPPDIPAHGTYEYLGLTKRIVESMNMADHITTTTTYLADEICEASDKMHDEVTVLKNSINQDIDQFRPKPQVLNENFIRVGWLGSESHAQDIASIKESLKRIHKDKDIRKKMQLVFGGFSMNENNLTRLALMPNGELRPQRIKSYETYYGLMERCFTDEFRILRGKDYLPYLEYLGKYVNDENPISKTMPYRRIWWKDVTKYMETYDEMDVVIIPMRDTPFNRAKSELKLIEAAFFGKAVIVSRVYPYTNICGEGVTLDVKPGMEYQEFHTQLRKLVLDPSEIRRLGTNLRREVIQHYNMDVVNHDRAELYKEVIRKKNAN